MSGIVALVNFDGKPIDTALLKKMALASAYRGPDGINYWVHDNVGFGHLAAHTTPESLTERQPLVSQSGELVLVADARVDNREELIRTLYTTKYTSDSSPGDAELIIAAYERWGTSCADHIIGDFAFLIWNATKRQLFCARDPVGARPFCYCISHCYFKASSEIGQLLKDVTINRDLDGYHISDFLTFNFRDQSRTHFASIQKLLPGHCLTIDKNGPCSWRYWNPEKHESIQYKDTDDYVDHFRDLLIRCISDRMRTLRSTVAIMTSGGVDSSTIACFAQDLFQKRCVAGRPVSYTYRFNTLKECDEGEFSVTLSKQAGLDLYPIDAEQFNFISDAFNNDPSLDSLVPCHNGGIGQVFELAKNHDCQIVMTGYGGDSLFDAAKWQYIDYARTGRFWKLWPWAKADLERGSSWHQALRTYIVRPFVPRYLLYYLDKRRSTGRYWQMPPWLDPGFQAKASSSRRLYNQAYPRRYFSRARQDQYEDIISLAQQGIAIESWNRRTAEHHMEARHPLLDRRLADFVLSVPIELSANPGPNNTKWLLRAAGRGIVPEKIRRRSTKGSGTPYIKHGMCGQANNRLRKLFSNTKMAEFGLIDDTILKRDFEAYCSGNSRYHSGNVFIPPMLLERWLQTHAHECGTVCFDNLESWRFK